MGVLETSAEVLSRYLITKENHEISHGPVGVAAKTPTANLLNTIQGFCGFGGKFFLHLRDENQHWEDAMGRGSCLDKRGQWQVLRRAATLTDSQVIWLVV